LKNKKKLKELHKKDLKDFFDSFEEKLQNEKQNLTYVNLGGAALVLLEVIPRSTTDIDIVRGDLDKLVSAGSEFGITIQKITQCTTVDFDECSKLVVYSKGFLEVFSISLEDLLKSKIERYYKQDPKDIDEIISRLHLPYKDFKKLFGEMFLIYIGDGKRLTMNARTVVDRSYPADADDFYKSFKI
jgi:hypothetical protein